MDLPSQDLLHDMKNDLDLWFNMLNETNDAASGAMEMYYIAKKTYCDACLTKLDVRLRHDIEKNSDLVARTLADWKILPTRLVPVLMAYRTDNDRSEQKS